MAGEIDGEALCAYLSRLLDRRVTADDGIALRSVQKAALAAWARKTGIAVSATVLASRGTLTPRMLLEGSREGDVPPRRRAPDARPSGPAVAILGVGIDIEEVESLPRPDDYRTHPFFRDQFSDAEIAHCLQQADVGASFCGTWAAKEAILKSGLASGRLGDIAITHDAAGRPHHPGCQISISYTRHAAVALCLRLAEPSPGRIVPIPGEPPPVRAPATRRLPTIAVAASALVVAVATVVVLIQVI